MFDSSIKVTGGGDWKFKRHLIKKSLRKVGQQVRKDARKRHGNEYPNKKTGAMLKAISYKMGSGGGYVKIYQKLPTENKEFYPAFLFYGHGYAKRHASPIDDAGDEYKKRFRYEMSKLLKEAYSKS